MTVEPEPLPAQLAGMQPFLDRLLSKDPADRLHTCGEVTAIIDAMLGNWMRNGSVDRVTDGVEMRPSGQQAARRDMDGVPAAGTRVPGHAGPDASTIAMPSGHTEPTIAIGSAPAHAHAHEHAHAPASAPLTASIEAMRSRADQADPGLQAPAGRSMAMSTKAALGAGLLLVAGVAVGVWIGRAGTTDAPAAPAPVVQASVQAPVVQASSVHAPMQSPVVQATLPAEAAARAAHPAPTAGTAPHTTPTAAATASPRGAEDAERSNLLARIAGRWAFAGSSTCAEFTISGNMLVQRWPGIAEAREHVDSAARGSVATTVQLPSEQRGQHYTYTPMADGRLEVHDVKRGRSDILQTCGERH